MMVHSIQKAQNIVGGIAVYSLKNSLSFKAFAYINFESRDVCDIIMNLTSVLV